MPKARLSVFYPKGEGEKFDHDYYKNSHVPLAVEAWKPESTTIERGAGGPYEAAVHFTFASRADLDAALGSPKTGDIQADVANYTSISPVMQFSEVVS